MDIERFLTVTEAAEVIGCTPGRVRQMVASGEIKARRLSPRMILVPRKEAERIAKAPATVGRPRINPRR